MGCAVYVLLLCVDANAVVIAATAGGGDYDANDVVASNYSSSRSVFVRRIEKREVAVAWHHLKNLIDSRNGHGDVGSVGQERSPLRWCDGSSS